MLGSSVGHYRIESQLGQGGMGAVYLARDEVLGRAVAIKVVRPELLGDESARLRFLREARTAASLDHPFVCRVFDVLDSEHGPALVMERIRGATLAEWVESSPSPDEVLRLGSEIAEAVAAAHAAGIIHRDLKPGNILVPPSGHPKILDFGLAKQVVLEADETQRITERLITREAAIFGTWGYLAPELLRGDKASVRSDLFALGCILYYMAIGEQPFVAATPADGISRTLSIDPDPPSDLGSKLPKAFDALVATLLAKDPEDRPESAVEVIETLRKLRGDSGAQPPPKERSRGRSSLWKVAVGIGLVLLVAILALKWSSTGETLAGDLGVLPLRGAPSGFDAPGMLLEGLSTRLASARLLSPEQLGTEEELAPDRREGLRHVLRWSLVSEGDEQRVRLEVDGDPGLEAEYAFSSSSAGAEALRELVEGPVVEDIAAFLLSLDERGVPYPSGYEQERASPITASKEAAQIYLNARALYRSGRTWEALRLTEQALEIDPRFAQANALRGRLLFNLGTPYTGVVLSLPYMEQALALPHRLEPSQLEVLSRARQFLTLGPAPTIPPLPRDSLASLGEVPRVEAEYAVLFFRGERERSLELSLDLLAKTLDSFEVFMNAGGILLDLGYSAAAAEQAMRPILEAHPEDPRSHLALGVLLIVHPEAVDLAEASLARSRELQGGQWQPHFAWLAGKMEYFAGRYDRSLEILTEALKSSRPEDRFTSSRLEEMAQAAHQEPHTDPRIYAFLALASRALGRLEDAHRYLAAHRRVLPGNPWTDYEEGRILMALEEPEKAIEAFSRALSLDSAYSYAWLRRGKARLLANDESGAQTDLDRFVEMMGPEALDHPRVVEALELLHGGASSP